MARKKLLLLKWSAFRHCPEKYEINRKLTFFFGKYQNISSHVLKILSISLVLRTRENADIFNTFDEIELGDNCVQNVHLGRYTVGYIVRKFRFTATRI